MFTYKPIMININKPYLLKQFRFVYTLVLISCTISISAIEIVPSEESADTIKPKNIILLIGDGMGLSQISSAFYYGDTVPNFSRFPIVGLISTSSSSHKITDSAAGATAFSTGKKIKNKQVGIDAAGKDLENLVEYFSKLGKSTGLIATSSITHATPAAFFAHNSSRYRQKSIGDQLPISEVDFFAGGGLQDFSNKDLKEFHKQGFTIYRDSLRNIEFIKEIRRE